MFDVIYLKSPSLKRGIRYGVDGCKYASYKESNPVTVINISQLVLELFVPIVKVVLRRQIVQIKKHHF